MPHAGKTYSFLLSALRTCPASSASLWNAAAELLHSSDQTGPAEKSNADLFHLIESEFAQPDNLKHPPQLLAYFLFTHYRRTRLVFFLGVAGKHQANSARLGDALQGRKKLIHI